MRWVAPLLTSLLVLGLAAPAAVRAAEGTVRGTVTPTAIAQEVEVCVAESQPPGPCTTAAADGSYSLTGLQTRPLRIEFIPPYHSRYMVEYWDHVYTLAEATPVPLSSNNPLVEDVDAALVTGGVIEGTVTGSGGPALTGVEVCAFDSRGAAAACSQTDAAGEYELHSLSPDSYRVRFFARGPSAEYVSEYYAGAKTPAAATPIALTAGEVRGAVDAELVKGGQVRGTVRSAAQGAPLQSIPVCLFVVGAAAAERCVFSDSGGAYAFVGLSSGGYQVGFALGGAEIDGGTGETEVGGYLAQYYDHAASRVAARSISVVGAAVVDDIDAALLAPAPPLSVPSTPTSESLVPAALPVAEPKPPPRRCKRGYVKRKRRDKSRCVKSKHKKHHRNHKRKPNRPGGGHTHR